MKFRVLKFGGTSVATIPLMQAIVPIIKEYCEQGYAPVVVLSAMGDSTDKLYAQAQQISKEPDLRSLDLLLSQGEQISIALMAMILAQQGLPAVALTAAQAGIGVIGAHGNAKIQQINSQTIQKTFRSGKKVCVVAGFQGVHLDHPHEVYTLGRGGSDTSALALAAALGCSLCEIYTDVDGVYTANPNQISTARLLQTIDYEEMLEMSRLGAGVLHSRCVSIAAKYDITIHVRSSKQRRPGTLVYRRQTTRMCRVNNHSSVPAATALASTCGNAGGSDSSNGSSGDGRETNRLNLSPATRSKKWTSPVATFATDDTSSPAMQSSPEKKATPASAASSPPSPPPPPPPIEGPVITGVTLKVDESRLTVHHIPDRPGLAAEMFQELSAQDVNVNMIAQSTGLDKKNSISFTVLQSSLETCKEILQRFIAKQKSGTLEITPEIGIISVIGWGMISTSGIAGTVFASLAKEKINIEMIGTSEIKLSVVVDRTVAELALKAVHEALAKLI